MQLMLIKSNILTFKSTSIPCWYSHPIVLSATQKRNKFLAGAFSNSTGFHTAEPAAVFRGGGALHDGTKMAAEFADQAAKEELEAEFLLGLCW